MRLNAPWRIAPPSEKIYKKSGDVPDHGWIDSLAKSVSLEERNACTFFLSRLETLTKMISSIVRAHTILISKNHWILLGMGGGGGGGDFVVLTVGWSVTIVPLIVGARRSSKSWKSFLQKFFMIDSTTRRIINHPACRNKNPCQTNPKPQDSDTRRSQAKRPNHVQSYGHCAVPCVPTRRS